MQSTETIMCVRSDCGNVTCTFALNNLRSEIFRGATQRPGTVGELLGEAEVRHLEVSTAIQQEILWLEISAKHNQKTRPLFFPESSVHLSMNNYHCLSDE